MNKLEVKERLPIAITHPQYGTSVLELKRQVKEGKYIYVAQYRSVGMQCSYGTHSNNWRQVIKEIIPKLVQDKLMSENYLKTI